MFHPRSRTADRRPRVPSGVRLWCGSVRFGGAFLLTLGGKIYLERPAPSEEWIRLGEQAPERLRWVNRVSGIVVTVLGLLTLSGLIDDLGHFRTWKAGLI